MSSIHLGISKQVFRAHFFWVALVPCFLLVFWTMKTGCSKFIQLLRTTVLGLCWLGGLDFLGGAGGRLVRCFFGLVWVFSGVLVLVAVVRCFF